MQSLHYLSACQLLAPTDRVVSRTLAAAAAYIVRGTAQLPAIPTDT
eukprot:COSAG05_NODE_22274_length_266_cov_0.562874_1_plen_45_part_10